MKFVSQVVVTILLCFALQYFLPWWTLAVGAFSVGYIFKNNGFVSFGAGFIGAALLWGGMSYFLDNASHFLLSEKIDRLLPLNALLFTMLIGGVTGGFAALTGALLPTKKSNQYR